MSRSKVAEMLSALYERDQGMAGGVIPYDPNTSAVALTVGAVFGEVRYALLSRDPELMKSFRTGTWTAKKFPTSIDHYDVKAAKTYLETVVVPIVETVLPGSGKVQVSITSPLDEYHIRTARDSKMVKMVNVARELKLEFSRGGQTIGVETSVQSMSKHSAFLQFHFFLNGEHKKSISEDAFSFAYCVKHFLR